ncbi:BlaI/MecI/CopY family transcriptional regulator [Pseudoalteromonas fenneropenaei]|uniref:BlaI/MecI/CopY family transcriptional regulator n=1 Tax=Pseudoalteromonas fenneropenaei TaxID=1737459 RepID=A0ABV7CPT2_9GAMM
MIELSKAEFAVMEALWQGHPAKANDIIGRLSDHSDWHEKTIKTLLGRLVKKQAIDFTKEGREYIYRPLISREEYTLKASRSFLSHFFNGRLTPLISGFAKSQQLSQQDIDELKQVIQDWENQKER